ncbi:uncharacterized protein fam83e [Polymixia lowei]
MSNSQEQSLDENVVFLPVTESCPEFLHCEGERHALERLMHAGPGAFYSCLGAEHLGCFLSPEEVNLISVWTQEYHISQLQVGEEENPEDGSSGMQDFSACYFPTHSDTPAPVLELGWPEKGSWTGRGCVTIHTSPPADGEPSIREIIRRYLQGASQVIAIVTDRLTDGAVISDLHKAASRGVPVYIILNQRSIQENFTPNRLMHPNMQVRALGGKTFCSREGRMVEGEMKDNFLLLDLETVIHGNYSLTWTDAHLHRQLITVLNGPIVEAFDQEFRILFAASSPIPDAWKVTRAPMDVPHQMDEPSDLHRPKHLPPEHVTSPPPPLPVDSPLDWEAMGVVQRGRYFPDSPVIHEEITAAETPLQNVTPFEEKTSTMDEFALNRIRLLDEKRKYDNTLPLTNNLQDKPSSFKVGQKIQRAYYRQVSKERSTGMDERTTVKTGENRREPDSRHNTVTFPASQRRERSMRENILEDEINMDGTSFRADIQSSSRKPLILKVPQSDSFSSLSDIMRRLQPKQSSLAQYRRGSKTVASQLSRSMMDLSVQNTDSTQEERGTPVPRLQANYFDPDRMTPAFALMKKRNDEIKYGLYRTPNHYLPSFRPRSTNFGLHMDWRKPQTDREGEHKEPE